MHTAAMLFYGTSSYSVPAPTLTGDPFTMTDEQLVRECLAHMMRQAGCSQHGEFPTMRKDVTLNRHADGAVTVLGNGWSVSVETDGFRLARETASVNMEKILPFIGRWSSVLVDASNFQLTLGR